MARLETQFRCGCGAWWDRADFDHEKRYKAHLDAGCADARPRPVDEWKARHDMRRLAERLGIPDGTSESDAAYVNRCVDALSGDLSHATDDQLRAECSRRGIGHVSEPMCTVAERDEWKREHGLLNAEYSEHRKVLWATLRELGCAEGADPLAFLRDLKRRAEAAEARAERLRADLNDEKERVCALENARADGRESAATKPADEHYVDPLDLLADDAP